jgi:hypothetical protein
VSYLRQVDPEACGCVGRGRGEAWGRGLRRIANVGSGYLLDPLERTVLKEPTEQVRNIRFDTPCSGQHTR